MYLLWLRVAAILYAGACVAVFPAVLYKVDRWRRWCVHLGGMAWFFHFVSAVEMLVQAHRLVPVGFREVQSLLGLAVVSVFFLVWWLYDAISLGLFALPATFFMVFIPALGPDRYTFPSQGVRVSWLIAHIAALLFAYVALGFSLLSSVLYLAQETSLGAAYFLDPKIIAAFVSWAIYVLLLLVRRAAGLRGRRAAYLSGVVFAVMVVVWTAKLISSVHRFGAQ